MSSVGAKAKSHLGAVGPPLLYAAGAVALGMALPRYEAAFFPDLAAPIGAGPAIALLSAIASGMLPLTGLVFSLAFVMVQFSATAYSPRLVTWFAGSAVMSHSLGIFTATFIYSLAALAWVDRGGTGKVPLLTVWFALVLLLVSVVVFVLLVEKLGMLQISRVLAYAGDRGRGSSSGTTPRLAQARRKSRSGRQAPGGVAGCRAPRRACGHPGHRRAGLVALAGREGAVVGWRGPRRHLVDGMRSSAFTAAGGPSPSGDCGGWSDSGRRHVRAGPQVRDPHPRRHRDQGAIAGHQRPHDRGAGPRPGGRPPAPPRPGGPEAGRVHDGRGSLRLVFPVPSWEDFLVLAFDEIRYCGANSIQVMRRMRALLKDLKRQVPAERRPALERYLKRVDSGIRSTFEETEDRKDALEEDRQGLGLSRERQEE